MLNGDGSIENLVHPVVEFTRTMEILRCFPASEGNDIRGENLIKYVDSSSGKMLNFLVKQEGACIKKTLLIKSNHLLRDVNKI